MRPSDYNLEVDNGDHVILINFLSRTVLELDQDAYRLFKRLSHSEADYEWSDEVSRFERVLIEGRFLCEDNADEFGYLSDLVSRARNDKRELAIVIAPTMGCNFSCHYCFEKKLGDGMLDSVADGIIRFVDENLAGCERLAVQWFGGEPLKELDTIERISVQLIQAATRHKVEYRAGVVTNGYFLSSAAALRLRALGVHTAQITLDGEKRMHDRIRRSECGSSYETILANIKAASPYLEIQLRVHVAPYNVDSISNLLADLAERGIADDVGGLYFARLFNYKPIPGRAQFLPDDKRFYTAEDYASVMTRLTAEAVRLGFPVADPLAVEFSVCTAVRRNAIVFGSSGSLYKCYFELDDSKEAVGNVESGVEPSDRLLRWLNHDVARDEECRACKFLPVCLGGCSHKWHTGAPKEVICTHLRYSAPELFRILYGSGMSS